MKSSIEWNQQKIFSMFSTKSQKFHFGRISPYPKIWAKKDRLDFDNFDLAVISFHVGSVTFVRKWEVRAVYVESRQHLLCAYKKLFNIILSPTK